MLNNGARKCLPSFLLSLALGAAGCSGSAPDPHDAEIAGGVQPAGSSQNAITTPQGSSKPASVVPGELIVKYKSDGKYAVTQDVQRWLSERRSFTRATADRSTSLDQLHAGISARAARALMPGRNGLSTADARRRLDARSVIARRRMPMANVARAPRSLADLANIYILEIPAGAVVVPGARAVTVIRLPVLRSLAIPSMA